jgi:hypothetical protein
MRGRSRTPWNASGAAPPAPIRTMGRTVPITSLIRELNVAAVYVPIVNFDNNQHGDNENLRLGN